MYKTNINEEIAFVTLSNDVSISNLKVNKGSNIPILVDDLKEKVKTKVSDFTAFEISRGILYLFGAKKDFKDKNLYRNIIKAIEKDNGKVIGVFAKERNQNIHRAYIMFEGYLNLGFDLSTEIKLELSREAYEKLNDKYYKSKFFEFYEKVENDNFLNRYQLASMYYFDREYEKALKHFSFCLSSDIDEDNRSIIKSLVNECSIKSIFEEGKKLLFSNRYQEALEKFLSIRDSYENWYELIFFTGVSYRMQGEINRALSSFYEALSVRNDDPELYNEIAICLIINEDYIEASKYLANALLIDSKHPDLLCNMAVTDYYLGNIDSSKKYISKALSLREDEITIKWSNLINAKQE